MLKIFLLLLIVKIQCRLQLNIICTFAYKVNFNDLVYKLQQNTIIHSFDLHQNIRELANGTRSYKQPFKPTNIFKQIARFAINRTCACHWLFAPCERAYVRIARQSSTPRICVLRRFFNHSTFVCKFDMAFDILLQLDHLTDLTYRLF